MKSLFSVVSVILALGAAQAAHADSASEAVRKRLIERADELHDEAYAMVPMMFMLDNAALIYLQGIEKRYGELGFGDLKQKKFITRVSKEAAQAVYQRNKDLGRLPMEMVRLRDELGERFDESTRKAHSLRSKAAALAD